MPASTKSKLPRDDSGQLISYAWPGGYPVYYLCADGGTLCPPCARGENGSEASENASAEKQWQLIAGDVYWEGPDTYCDHCNATLESAYGDPDEDSSETTAPAGE